MYLQIGSFFFLMLSETLHDQKYVDTQTNYVDIQILHGYVTDEQIIPKPWASICFYISPLPLWGVMLPDFITWLQGLSRIRPREH